MRNGLGSIAFTKFAELTAALPELTEVGTAMINFLYFCLAFSHFLNEIPPKTKKINVIE